MVGNKAKKAIAAALSGAMVLSAAAPAIAGIWTDETNKSWYRINGDHTEAYQLGTLDKDAEAMSGNPTGTVGQSGLVVKGQDRYDTMFDTINYNVSMSEWKQGDVKEIVLTSGESQADTLAAAGFAGTLNNYLGSPVITTPAGRLGTQAERAIRYYAEGQAKYSDLKVYIVGGEAAVSSAVEDAIKAIEKADENVEVERVAGADRVATSLEVAKQGDNEGWLDEDLESSKKVVYIANGTAWPDALSVSSLAYLLKTPILLTQADGSLSADQIAYLRKHDSVGIRVVGGPALPSVQQLYDEGFTRANVSYVGGVNRYETSAKVIEDFGGMSVENRSIKAIAVASGAEGHWADALVGGVFVGANEGVLALVDGVDEVTALKEAYKLQKEVSGVAKSATAEAPAWSFIIGGEAAIDKTFADKLNDNFPVR